MRRTVCIAALAATLFTASCQDKTVREAPMPELSSISPAEASTGDTVRISGKNFATAGNGNTVVFGTTRATVLASEQSSLDVLVPELEEGAHEVMVIVGENVAEGLSFTCVPRFSLISLAPATGHPGTEVRIFGTGFESGRTSVSFGGSPAEIKYATPTTLKAVAPNHAEGAVELVVRCGSRSAAATFTYSPLAITSNIPTSGPEGTEVVIKGEGFSSTAAYNTVTISGKDCPVMSASDTALTVKTPSGIDGTHPFTVTVGSSSVTGGSFTFTTPLYVETVAGSGTQAYKDGVGSAAGLGIIQSITKAAEGKYYLTQRGGSGKDGIRILSASDWSVTTLVNASNSVWGSSGHPWEGDFDSDGNFWFAVKASGTIAKVTPSGTASTISFTGDSRSLKTNPMSVKFGPDGKMYVLNRGTKSYIAVFGSDLKFIKEVEIGFMAETICWNTDSTKFFVGANGTPSGIHLLDVATGAATRIAGTGEKPTAATYCESESGKPLTATIGLIEGLCLAPDGTLYFSDATAFTVRKLTPGAGADYTKGTVSLVAGRPFSAGSSNGLATDSQFKYPCDIEILPDGSLLVADGTGAAVRRVYKK